MVVSLAAGPTRSCAVLPWLGVYTIVASRGFLPARPLVERSRLWLFHLFVVCRAHSTHFRMVECASWQSCVACSSCDEWLLSGSSIRAFESWRCPTMPGRVLGTRSARRDWAQVCVRAERRLVERRGTVRWLARWHNCGRARECVCDSVHLGPSPAGWRCLFVSVHSLKNASPARKRDNGST
jgi:hypothetical protein